MLCHLIRPLSSSASSPFFWYSPPIIHIMFVECNCPEQSRRTTFNSQIKWKKSIYPLSICLQYFWKFRFEFLSEIWTVKDLHLLDQNECVKNRIKCNPHRKYPFSTTIATNNTTKRKQILHRTDEEGENLYSKSDALNKTNTFSVAFVCLVVHVFPFVLR